MPLLGMLARCWKKGPRNGAGNGVRPNQEQEDEEDDEEEDGEEEEVGIELPFIYSGSSGPKMGTKLLATVVVDVVAFSVVVDVVVAFFSCCHTLLACTSIGSNRAGPLTARRVGQTRERERDARRSEKRREERMKNEMLPFPDRRASQWPATATCCCQIVTKCPPCIVTQLLCTVT